MSLEEEPRHARRPNGHVREGLLRSTAMDSRGIGIVAALGSAASWALGAVLFKKLGQQLSSPGMALVKSLVSTLLLALVVLCTGFETMSAQTLGWLILSGTLGIALGDTLFFAALKALSPQALVVLLTSGQVLTVLLAIVLLGEHPTPKAWGGIALVTTGITLVLRVHARGAEKGSQFRGVALGILSVICMSVSLIVAKKGLSETSALQATLVRMLAAGLVLLGLSRFQGQGRDWLKPFRNSRLLGQFCASVCMVTFGGFWLSLLAVKHLEVAVANTLNSAEPLFVVPLAAWWLKERVTMLGLTGAALAVVGISLLWME